MEVRVVFVGAEGEENLGYVARAMDNFGFKELILVRPKARITDVSMQRAMRGQAVLNGAKTRPDIESAVRGSTLVVGTTGKTATEKNLLRSASAPKEFAKNVSRCDGVVSLLFGRESSGLTNEELKKCDLIVTIPTDDSNPALNVSNAVAIVLYELFISNSKKRTLPSGKEKMIVYGFFADLLAAAGHSGRRSKTIGSVFRNIVERSLVSRNELFTMAGALRKMREKLKNKQNST